MLRAATRSQPPFPLSIHPSSMYKTSFLMSLVLYLPLYCFPIHLECCKVTPICNNTNSASQDFSRLTTTTKLPDTERIKQAQDETPVVLRPELVLSFLRRSILPTRSSVNAKVACTTKNFLWSSGLCYRGVLTVFNWSQHRFFVHHFFVC